MYYAVTDERVIINSNFSKPYMIVLPVNSLPLIIASFTDSGNGTILFGDGYSEYAQLAETGLEFLAKFQRGGGMLAPPAFYDISDAQQVAGLLNEMRRRAMHRESKVDDKT